MSYNHLISDPSTYVRKRTQRSEDSILLRHMDDEVGAGPDEQLMSDLEHMKTSLYLTDVVVLRHEGDTVNFLGLENTKTNRGFEVKNSADLVESLLNLYVLENSKPTANPGRRSRVLEHASAIPLDGHDHSNFRTAVGKLIFTVTLETRHAIRHPTTIHTSPQSHNREQARSETVDTISQKARNTPVFVLNRAEWFQNGLLELVGRRDSDWTGDSATCQSVTEYHCNVLCHCLKQTGISLSSCEAEFYAASACAGELLGLAELFKELHYNVSVRLEMDSDSARHIPQRRGPGGPKHIEIRCLAVQQWIREKSLSVGRVDTKDNTADLFTKHLDGPRTQSLARKLGLRIQEGTNGDD